MLDSDKKETNAILFSGDIKSTSIDTCKGIFVSAQVLRFCLNSVKSVGLFYDFDFLLDHIK